MTDSLDTRTFEQEIRTAINRHSMENGSNTPDFILTEYLLACLDAFDTAVTARSAFFGGFDTADPGDADDSEVKEP